MWPEINRRLVQPRLAPHQRYFPIPKPDDEADDSPRPGFGLYRGEPENCRRDVRQFLRVLTHLALLLAVFKVYRIEGRAFQGLVAIALAALPIHYLLPYRWKKPFFIGVSAAGLFWVFGAGVAATVLALAVPMIGACFLPVPWTAKALIVTIIALGCGWARSGAVAAIPDLAWPIVGSIFMFRMILYLYEMKHAEKPETLVDTLGYFFLLPNYCFPLFPVVDYRAYRRGYFESDVHELQRVGLRLMFRGTIHLLLYRLVYHEWLITAAQVQGPASLARFLIGNYLCYLHVSGQFHMACGMLHLFGFRLPETHHRYLLASGFTDYWRRINIYWKDFMVRVVFNPVVFRLKRWPRPAALAAATVVVFVVTWALHGYQTFWLRGTWKLSAPDALFWGILGSLVLVNVQLDARKAAAPRDRTSGGSPRLLAVRSLKTAGTFATIVLLWSLWSSPSVGAWLTMLRAGLGQPR